MKVLPLVFVCLVGLSLFHPQAAFANKSAVSIEAPASTKKGTEVIVKVTVTHKGNSYFHYTEWLKVDVNGKTVARYDFARSDRPEAENFSRDVKVKADGTLRISAEASCNIHGSAGPAQATVAVQD